MICLLVRGRQDIHTSIQRIGACIGPQQLLHKEDAYARRRSKHKGK